MVGRNVSLVVLSTVNAPYGTRLTAQELADLISSRDSATSGDASAFAFFSEVSEELQIAFVEEMGLDMDSVKYVAVLYSDMAGYPLALAPADRRVGM